VPLDTHARYRKDYSIWTRKRRGTPRSACENPWKTIRDWNALVAHFLSCRPQNPPRHGEGTATTGQPRRTDGALHEGTPTVVERLAPASTIRSRHKNTGAAEERATVTGIAGRARKGESTVIAEEGARLDITLQAIRHRKNREQSRRSEPCHQPQALCNRPSTATTTRCSKQAHPRTRRQAATSTAKGA